MFDLFGAEMPLAVRFFLAFLVVLGLIGATAWAVRRFGGGRLSSTARGRQPRLAVIDYASVDARRRLILVRRDNVEHLLMIGGPTDIVVEPNIVRATPAARDVPSARPPVAADAVPRVIPLPEAPSNGSWPLQPEPAGPPLPPAPPRRAPRVEPIQEEQQRTFPPPPPPSETPPRQQREVLAALAEDLAASSVPPSLPRNRAGGPPRPPQNEPRAEARPEPRMPAPSADAEAPSAVDQNLAEMAQRLEAALRKPKAIEARLAPVPSPSCSNGASSTTGGYTNGSSATARACHRSRGSNRASSSAASGLRPRRPCRVWRVRLKQDLRGRSPKQKRATPFTTPSNRRWQVC